MIEQNTSLLLQNRRQTADPTLSTVDHSFSKMRLLCIIIASIAATVIAEVRLLIRYHDVVPILTNGNSATRQTAVIRVRGLVRATGAAASIAHRCCPAVRRFCRPATQTAVVL
ncbi:hypothetical protein IG631_19141 [Alternaria alternata]|nr:hypothetical protein IG631_19141 [Alternaria alternata]